VPDLAGSTLVAIGDNHFVDSVTGMVLSRIGTVKKSLGYEYFFHYGVEKVAHRVIWEAANGRQIPDGLTINHWDGVKDNNRPDNLDLATDSEQIMHSWWLGSYEGKRLGENAPRAKLTNAQVVEIREFARTHQYHGVQADLARKYGLTPSSLSKVIRGDTYK
jgi:hypothetical protein